MKNNYHRALFHPDYFGWHYYCDGAARRQKRSDKKQAKKAARIDRKKISEDDEDET